MFAPYRLSSLLATRPVRWALIAALAVISFSALADPPTMPLPSTTTDQNSLILQLWGWALLLLKIFVTLVGVAAFAWVAWSAVQKFAEVRMMGAGFIAAVPHIGVGLFLLALIGVLLTIAWTWLTSTTLAL